MSKSEIMFIKIVNKNNVPITSLHKPVPLFRPKIKLIQTRTEI